MTARAAPYRASVGPTAPLTEALIKSMCADWGQPGLAVGVVTEGDTVETFCTGVRQIGKQGTVTADTLFAAASLTKSFAAATVGVLVDQERLGFDDRVQRYLPDFTLFADPDAAAELTIRDLLSNRHGITSSEGRHRRCATNKTDLMARMRYQPLRHRPRRGYGYASDAFTCVGAIVEAVTGERWDSFADRTLWQPLGMRRTNADHRLSRGDRDAATPHVIAGTRAVPIPWAYEEEAATPAGGLNSTVKDLTQWIRLFLNMGMHSGQQILQEQTIQALLAPQVDEVGPFADNDLSGVVGRGPGGIERQTYALGWYQHQYHGARVCYHTGSIDGFRAILGFLPEHQTGLVVLANADNNFLPRALFQQFVDHVLQRPDQAWSDRMRRYEADIRHSPQHTITSPPETACSVDLERLCGRYHDHTGFGEAIVSLARGYLVLTAGAASFDLIPLGGLTFTARSGAPYAPLDQFTADWRLDTDGRPTCFTTTQDAVFAYLCP